jgi:toxin ParE1/3/4
LIIEWLPRAEKDLDVQLDYIEQESIQAADVVAERIQHQVGQLAQFPDLGRVGRKRGTRELVISRTSLVLVYRVRPKLARIEMLRVLHERQQWPKSNS